MNTRTPCPFDPLVLSGLLFQIIITLVTFPNLWALDAGTGGENLDAGTETQHTQHAPNSWTRQQSKAPSSKRAPDSTTPFNTGDVSISPFLVDAGLDEKDTARDGDWHAPLSSSVTSQFEHGVMAANTTIHDPQPNDT